MVSAAVAVAAGVLVALGGTYVLVAVGAVLLGCVVLAPSISIGVLSVLPYLFNTGRVSLGGVMDLRLLQILWLGAGVGAVLLAAVKRERVRARLPRAVLAVGLALVLWELLAALNVGTLRSFVEVAQTGYLAVVGFMCARLWVTADARSRRIWLGVSGTVLLGFAGLSFLDYATPAISIPYYVVQIGAGVSVSKLPAVVDAVSAYGIPRFALAGVGPTGTASVFVASFAVAAGIAIAAPRERRSLLAVAVAVVSAVGLLLTLSRAGWLVGLLVGTWIAVRAGARRVVPMTVTLAIVVAALVFVPSLSSRFADIVNPQEGSNLSHQRLYETALFMAGQRPVLGYGPGQFAMVASRLGVGGRTEVNIEAIDAHNFFLQEAAESGLPAALLEVALIGLVFVWAWPRVARGPQWTYGVLVASIGVVLMGLTMNIFRTEVFWCLLGVLIGIAGAVTPDADSISGTDVG